jgi:hypothetical protein
MTETVHGVVTGLHEAWMEGQKNGQLSGMDVKIHDQEALAAAERAEKRITGFTEKIRSIMDTHKKHTDERSIALFLASFEKVYETLGWEMVHMIKSVCREAVEIEKEPDATKRSKIHEEMKLHGLESASRVVLHVRGYFNAVGLAMPVDWEKYHVSQDRTAESTTHIHFPLTTGVHFSKLKEMWKTIEEQEQAPANKDDQAQAPAEMVAGTGSNTSSRIHLDADTCEW